MVNIDTGTSLGTASTTARLLTVRNAGVEKLGIDGAGRVTTASGLTVGGAISATTLTTTGAISGASLESASSSTLVLKSNQANGTSAIMTTLDTGVALGTTGSYTSARLLSIRSAGAEKFGVDGAGRISLYGIVTPAVDNSYTLGATSFAFSKVFTNLIAGSSGATRIDISASNPNTYTPGAGSFTGAHQFMWAGSAPTGDQPTLMMASFHDAGGTARLQVQYSGKLVFDSTTAGSAGAVTIDKPSGRPIIAAAASSVVVTNKWVSATSIVYAVLQAADATCTQVSSVVPGAGTFTINVNAACTAQTRVGFVVFNQ